MHKLLIAALLICAPDPNPPKAVSSMGVIVGGTSADGASAIITLRTASGSQPYRLSPRQTKALWQDLDAYESGR